MAGEEEAVTAAPAADLDHKAEISNFLEDECCKLGWRVYFTTRPTGIELIPVFPLVASAHAIVVQQIPASAK